MLSVGHVFEAFGASGEVHLVGFGAVVGETHRDRARGYRGLLGGERVLGGGDVEDTVTVVGALVVVMSASGRRTLAGGVVGLGVGPAAGERAGRQGETGGGG